MRRGITHGAEDIFRECHLLECKKPGSSPGFRVRGFPPYSKIGVALDPALTLVLTFNPRATVWLWLWHLPNVWYPPVELSHPALTPVLTFRPRATVWL